MSTIDPSECFVGLPIARIHDEKDKRLSKIGGQPVWWDELSAPSSIEELQCRSCNSSESVIFVAQLYAPTDCDRSLYLFCCDKRECSLRGEGWTVFRNQQAAVAPASEGQKSATASSFSSLGSAAMAPIPPPAVAAASSSSSSSTWGSLLAGDDDIDMMQLLEARDAALALRKAAPLSSGSKAAKGAVERDPGSSSRERDPGPLIPDPESSSPLLPQALVCWKVEAISDPCPFGADILIHAALRGGEEEEEADRRAAPHSLEAAQHVQQMLAGYIAAAEAEGGDDLGGDDPALLDLLRREMAGGRGRREREQEDSAVPSSSVRGTEEERDGDPMLNKSDCSSRVEAAFQSAVSHAPSQVVRFAYGGYPLWCSYPPPSVMVPPCACGKERVFEMQLMPGLFSLQPLFTPSHLEKKTIGSSGSALPPNPNPEGSGAGSAVSLLERLGDTSFDFGVVAVYSCPDSCSSLPSPSAAGGGARDRGTSPHIHPPHIHFEHVVVQAPADF